MKVRLFQDAPHKEGKYYHEIFCSSLFQVSRNKKVMGTNVSRLQRPIAF
jgi:predicted cupin superfamily sugar epimerase